VTEQRLLALEGNEANLFVTGHGERLAAAYLRRVRDVAYRSKPGAASKTAKTGKTSQSGAKKKAAK